MLEITVEPTTVVTRGGVVGEERTDHTLRAIISTETPTLVYDANRGGMIWEVVLSSGFVGDDRIPMFRDHGKASANSTAHYSEEFLCGSVLRVAVTGDKVVGELSFARDAVSQRARDKVIDGHLRGVSPGYAVLEYQECRDGQSIEVLGKVYTAPKRELLRVSSRWYCREISIVPIPANRDAMIARGWSRVESRPMQEQPIAERTTPPAETELTPLDRVELELHQREMCGDEIERMRREACAEIETGNWRVEKQRGPSSSMVLNSLP